MNYSILFSKLCNVYKTVLIHKLKALFFQLEVFDQARLWFIFEAKKTWGHASSLKLPQSQDILLKLCVLSTIKGMNKIENLTKHALFLLSRPSKLP